MLEKKKKWENFDSAKELELFFQELNEKKIIRNSANPDNFFSLDILKNKSLYWGVDCTGDSLHIGHLYQIIQLFRFIEKGFRVIVVIGNSTSAIGDPSDKEKKREEKTKKIIDFFGKNIQEQIKQVFLLEPLFSSFAQKPLFFFDTEQKKKILNVLGIEADEKVSQWKKFFCLIRPNFSEDKVLFLENGSWLEKLTYLEFLEHFGKKITMNYLLNKDWVNKRLKGSGLSYSEFSYSLLQSYDFYYLYKNYDCFGQLGGSDQWGNITTSLKLINSFFPNDNKTFAFCFNLLSDKTGKKLSKSDPKSSLFLNSSYPVFFDYFRNLSDELAIKYLTEMTFLSTKQINQLLELNNPPSNRILQKILLELNWVLNFGEIESLVKTAEEKKSENWKKLFN